MIVTAKRIAARARLAAAVRAQLLQPRAKAVTHQPARPPAVRRVLSGAQHVATFGSYEEFVRADRREELIAESELWGLR